VNGFSDLSLYNPICMVKLPERNETVPEITDLKWDTTSSKVLVSCKNGFVYEVNKPNPLDVNNKETYLVENYPMKEWRIKMMEF